jgi:hypothetical protein
MKVQDVKINYREPDFPTHFANSKRGGFSIGGQLSVTNQEPVNFERKFLTNTTEDGKIYDNPYPDSFSVVEHTGTHSIKSENYGISADLTRQYRAFFFSVLAGTSLNDIALNHIGIVLGLSRNIGNFTPTIAVGSIYSHFSEEQTFIKSSPNHTDLNGIWAPDSSRGENSVLNFSLKIGLMGQLNVRVFPYITYTLNSFDFEPNMSVIDTGSVYDGTERELGLYTRTHSFGLGAKYKWSEAIELLVEGAYVNLIFPSTYRSYHFSSSIRLVKEF